LQQVAGQSFYKDAHYFGVDGQYHAINRGDGVLLLADIKRTATPVLKSASASVWDIGDGVLCLEFTGKMNTLDETVFQIMHQVIALIGDGSGAHKALVIYNEGSAFSAGANLGLALFAANIALWPQIESLVEGGQNAYMALKYAPFPVVSAPANLALGGGCEILLHSDHIQAHAETYTGLVEVGVGVVPGWGGCKEMILRFQALERAQKAKLGNSNLSPMEATKKAFEVIATATTAKSAQDAKEIGYFRATDGVTMNRDRLLYDAKQQALRLSENYTPPIPVTDIRLSGKSGLLALTMAVNELHKSGKATDYDVVVSTALVRILSGGDKADINTPLTEQDILKLERTEFMNLVKQSGTLARIQHMLDTGKPLRN
jgi:3-hydroxyacyl-CoA dehydrogenase